MKSDTVSLNAIDDYISQFEMSTQKVLQQMRKTIKKVAPAAEEVMSYQMPAYKYHGMLVYFAGYKSHIGFYPTPSAIAHFKAELSVYKNAKGSVQFPLDKPLPIKLIEKMVAYRVKENEELASVKQVSSRKKK